MAMIRNDGRLDCIPFAPSLAQEYRYHKMQQQRGYSMLPYKRGTYERTTDEPGFDKRFQQPFDKRFQHQPFHTTNLRPREPPLPPYRFRAAPPPPPPPPPAAGGLYNAYKRIRQPISTNMRPREPPLFPYRFRAQPPGAGGMYNTYKHVGKPITTNMRPRDPLPPPPFRFRAPPPPPPPAAGGLYDTYKRIGKPMTTNMRPRSDPLPPPPFRFRAVPPPVPPPLPASGFLYNTYKRATLRFKKGLAELVPRHVFGHAGGVQTFVDAVDYLVQQNIPVSLELLEDCRISLSFREKYAKKMMMMMKVNPVEAEGHHYFGKVLDYCLRSLTPLCVVGPDKRRRRRPRVVSDDDDNDKPPVRPPVRPVFSNSQRTSAWDFLYTTPCGDGDGEVQSLGGSSEANHRHEKPLQLLFDESQISSEWEFLYTTTTPCNDDETVTLESEESSSATDTDNDSSNVVVDLSN